MRAAWSFFALHWRRFLVPAFLLALGAFLATQGEVVGNAAVSFPGLVLWAALSILYPAAVYRFALRNEYGGFYGLRAGADEGRLALLGLSLALFLFLAGLAAFACLMVLAVAVVIATGDPAAIEAAMGDPAAMQAALGSVAPVIANAGMFAIFCFLLFLAARLALSAPATIAERRFVFLKSWPWTKGVFFRLFAVLVLAAVPGVAADVILANIGGAVSEAGAPVPGMALIFAGVFANALLGIVMSAGALAYMYRGLRPPETGSA